ncbi:unnamed protein product [Caretta caretta]
METVLLNQDCSIEELFLHCKQLFCQAGNTISQCYPLNCLETHFIADNRDWIDTQFSQFLLERASPEISSRIRQDLG